jgi:predicted metal-dependent peptidase
MNTPRNWKKELRSFLSKSAGTEIEFSKKLRNRRYGLLYPGKKRKPKLNLAVLVDSSGSMYNELLSQIFSEIKKINESFPMDITVIQCDTEVNSIEKYDPKKKITVNGRGGTSFAPAFKAAEELSPDAVIYFTDGDNFDKDEVKKPRYPVLWALPKECMDTLKYNWGKRVPIEINKK